MLGRILFHKCVSNSEYFKYINIGIKVLRGKKYYKKIILWQCGGIRAPLTIRSRMGLNRGIRAPLTTKSRMGLNRGIKAPLTIKSRMGFNRGIKTLLTIKSRIGLSESIA